MKRRDKNMFCSLEDELGIKIKKKLNIRSWFDAYCPEYANLYTIDRSIRSWNDVAQQYSGQIDNEATRERMVSDFATVGYAVSNGTGNATYTVTPTLNAYSYRVSNVRYDYSNFANTANVVIGEN